MTTTPTERRLAITPGDCKFTARNNDALISAGNKVVAEVGRADLEGWDQVMANATLYVDAHNTYNACGLTPSELLAKLKQAEDVVVHMVSAAKYHFKHGNDTNLDKQTDIADAFLSTLNLPKHKPE